METGWGSAGKGVSPYPQEEAPPAGRLSWMRSGQAARRRLRVRRAGRRPLAEALAALAVEAVGRGASSLALSRRFATRATVLNERLKKRRVVLATSPNMSGSLAWTLTR